jgi:hypothetical protein
MHKADDGENRCTQIINVDCDISGALIGFAESWVTARNYLKVS